MYYSKLVGIREKSWDIDGKKGQNKTLYFIKAEDSTSNNFLEGFAPHSYTLSPEHKCYNYDLKVNEEYLVMLGEGKANKNGVVITPIDEILHKDYKPVAIFNSVQK